MEQVDKERDILSALKETAECALFSYYSRNSQGRTALARAFARAPEGFTKYLGDEDKTMVPRILDVDEKNMTAQISNIARSTNGIFDVCGSMAVGKTTKFPTLMEKATGNDVIVIVPSTAVAVMTIEGVKAHFGEAATPTVYGETREVIGNTGVSYLPVGSFIRYSMSQHVLRYAKTIIVDEVRQTEPMMQSLESILRCYAKHVRVVRLSATRVGKTDYRRDDVDQEARRPTDQEIENQRVLAVVESKTATKQYVEAGYMMLDVNADHKDIEEVVERNYSDTGSKIVTTYDGIAGLNLKLDALILSTRVRRLRWDKDDGMQVFEDRVPNDLYVQAVGRLRNGGKVYSFSPKNLEEVKVEYVQTNVESDFVAWLKCALMGKEVQNSVSWFLDKKIVSEMAGFFDWKEIVIVNYERALKMGLRIEKPPMYQLEKESKGSLIVFSDEYGENRASIVGKGFDSYPYKGVERWPDAVKWGPTTAITYILCALRYRNYLLTLIRGESVGAKYYGTPVGGNNVVQMIELVKFISYAIEIHKLDLEFIYELKDGVKKGKQVYFPKYAKFAS